LIVPSRSFAALPNAFGPEGGTRLGSRRQ